MELRHKGGLIDTYGPDRHYTFVTVDGFYALAQSCIEPALALPHAPQHRRHLPGDRVAGLRSRHPVACYPFIICSERIVFPPRCAGGSAHDRILEPLVREARKTQLAAFWSAAAVSRKPYAAVLPQLVLPGEPP
jgi:hypothetical protein